MMLYSEPGTGKSVFAYLLGKELQKMEGTKKGAFFITTDGNYEWLEDFGADDNDHIQVNSYVEMVKAFQQPYNDYGTIVLDLVEDGFKWCEQEFVRAQGVTHVSDLGYGKGYDITRSNFFIDLCKLIGKSKHIILLSHESSKTSKDRRGIEHTSYFPSDKLPSKTLDSIEGRLRYVLRCYMKNEDIDTDDGKVRTISRRYLSLVPKEDEFGIIRGVNTNIIAQDIPLDPKAFLDIIYNDAYSAKLDDGTAAIPVHNLSAGKSEVEAIKSKFAEQKSIGKTPIVKSTEVDTPADEIEPVSTAKLLNKIDAVKQTVDEDAFDTEGIDVEVPEPAKAPIAETTSEPKPTPSPATTETTPAATKGMSKKDELRKKIEDMKKAKGLK